MNYRKMMSLLAASALTLSALTGCGAANADSSETAQASAGGEDGVFTIAYAPNESTAESADARNGLAEDLSAVLGCEVRRFRRATTMPSLRRCARAVQTWRIWARRRWHWASSAPIWNPSL